MKKLLTFCFLLFEIYTSAQIVEGEDGKYYNSDNSLYSGNHIEYFENGQVKLSINVIEGKLDKDVVYYFENGSKKEVRAYKLGQMHGTWITWNVAQVKIAEANYFNNKKDGKWYVWDENGVKRYEMEYKEGEKVGDWFIWNENGELINEKSFSDN